MLYKGTLPNMYKGVVRIGYPYTRPVIRKRKRGGKEKKKNLRKINKKEKLKKKKRSRVKKTLQEYMLVLCRLVGSRMR